MGRDYSWVQPREIGSVAVAWGPILAFGVLPCLVMLLLGFGAWWLVSCEWTAWLLLRAPTAAALALGARWLGVNVWSDLSERFGCAARCSLGPRGVGLTYLWGGRRHVAWDDLVRVEDGKRPGRTSTLQTTRGPVSLQPAMGDRIADVLRRRDLPEQTLPTRALGIDRLGLEPGETVVWRQSAGEWWGIYGLPWAYVAIARGVWLAALRAQSDNTAALMLTVITWLAIVMLFAVAEGRFVPRRRWAVTMDSDGIERRDGHGRRSWDWGDWLTAERWIGPHGWRARTVRDWLMLDDSDPVQARILHAITEAIAWRESSPPSRGGWVAPRALSRAAAPVGTPSSAAISRAT